MKITLRRKNKPRQEVNNQMSHPELEGSILSKFYALGFDFNRNPKDIPKEAWTGYVGNVTELSSADLGKYHTFYTELVAYAGEQLAKTDMELTVREGAYNNLLNHLTLAEDTDKITEARKRALDNPDIQAMGEALTQIRALRVLLEAKVTSYDKYASSISREITRRERDFENSLRDKNIK